MRRSPLLIVYLTVFIDLLGFGIILPSLPFYAQKFGANGLWVGAVLTAYSAAQFVGAIFLGRLSDRIGRRPILLLSLAGSAITLAASGLADSLLVLLLCRLLAGGFGGSISTAQAYIADVTTRAERTKYMGILGASIGMGFIFGPAIGAGLSNYGFGTAAFVAAAIAAANFVFGFFALRESRPIGRTASAHAQFTISSLVGAFRGEAMGPVLRSTLLATLAFTGMEATYALLGQARFGLDARGLGLVFFFVGIVIAIVQGGLIGRLSRRYGERTLAVSGALLMGVGLLGLPYGPTLPASIAILAVLAAGQGLLSPTLSSLLSLAADADEQGGTLGLGQSTAAAARAIGPLVAGWLFDQGVAIPYIVGAILVLVAALVLRNMPSPVSRTVVRTEAS